MCSREELGGGRGREDQWKFKGRREDKLWARGLGGGDPRGGQGKKEERRPVSRLEWVVKVKEKGAM